MIYNSSRGTGVIVNIATQETQDGFMTGKLAPNQDIVVYSNGNIFVSDLKGENIKCLAESYSEEE